MVNFDDIKKKAQDMLGKHGGKVEEGLDKASGTAKSKFGQHADKIDNVTDKAKGFIADQRGDNAGGPDEQGPSGGGQHRPGEQPPPSGQ